VGDAAVEVEGTPPGKIHSYETALSEERLLNETVKPGQPLKFDAVKFATGGTSGLQI
jgi:hypothetical protein